MPAGAGGARFRLPGQVSLPGTASLRSSHREGGMSPGNLKKGWRVSPRAVSGLDSAACLADSGDSPGHASGREKV